MTSDHEAEGYDNTPEGREVVALIQRYAPPVVNSRAGAEAVMRRIGNPRGRLLRVGTWLPPLIGAAAAVALAFVIFSPKPVVQPTNPPTAHGNFAPAPTQADIRREPAYPEIVAHVRGPSGEGTLIDAGLDHGLRVGDQLQGPGGTMARVTAVGVFDARVSVSGGKLDKGAELRAPVSTEAQTRAARYSDFGGDPGAFFQFGALVSAMPLSEARMLGISDGAALRVDETIGAILNDPAGAPKATIAARLDLRPGDVILEVNGASVRSANELGSALGWSFEPGLLTVRVLRNSKQLDLNLR